jgi:hypothetical protein
MALLLKMQSQIPHEAPGVGHLADVLARRFRVHLPAPDASDHLASLLDVLRRNPF